MWQMLPLVSNETVPMADQAEIKQHKEIKREMSIGI